MDLQELLARLETLAELSAEDLEALQNDLLDAYNERKEGALDDAAVLEEVGQIRDALVAIRAENTTRTEAAEERAKQLAEIEAEIEGTDEVSAQEEPEPDDDDEDEPAEAEEEPEVPESEVEPEAEEEKEDALVAAPVRTVRRKLPIPASHQPRQSTVSGIQTRLVAAGQTPYARQDGTFGSMRDAAKAQIDLLDTFRGAHHGPAQFHRVGSFQWDRGEERHLHDIDTARNTEKIGLVASAAQGGPDALVAAGGLCGPVDIFRDLVTVSVSDTPLIDSLPQFNADRGGLTFNASSTLADIVVDNTSGAIDTITVTDDEGDATKTVQTVSCGAESTVKVTAISERLKFTNFGDRYNPERMEQWMTLARAAHARRRERHILDAIAAASTDTDVPGVNLGAIRDFIATQQVAAAAFRNRHRTDENLPLEFVYPEWLIPALAVDLTLQQPGDDELEHTRQDIVNALSQFNARPVFVKEGETNPTTIGGVAQDFGAQSAGNLLDWPADVVWYMFVPGTFVYLDGGTLDFGIVRDSTLNAANRFETFYEVFQNVAKVGLQSLRVRQALCVSGKTSLPVAADCGSIPS